VALQSLNVYNHLSQFLLFLLISLAPSPLQGRPQATIVLTTAGATALVVIPAIALATAAATTGGLLTGINLGSKFLDLANN
jgi:ABC-type dipeptide/oligopeptide/nickel transport system permease component